MAIVKLPTYAEYKARVAASQPVVDLTEKEPKDTTPQYVPEDAKLISTPTASDIMSYGWNVKGQTDMNKLAKIGRIKGWYDVGKFDEGQYKTLTELYGEDFFDLSQDQRRERINQVEASNNSMDYLSVIAYGEDNSLLAGAVGLAGTLATPTSLITVPATVMGGPAGLALTSALFGAEYSLLEQYADKGDIDWGEFTTTTAFSGAAGLGLGIVGSRLVKAIQGSKNVSAVVRSEAQQKADEIQDAYYRAVEQDIPLAEIGKFVRDDLGMTTEELVDAVAKAPVKPKIPKNKAEATEARKIAQQEFNAETLTGDITVNKYLTPIIEGFAKIDDVFKLDGMLKNKVNGYFFKSYDNAMSKFRESEPLLNAYKKMPKEAQAKFDNLLLNSDDVRLKDARAMVEKYVPGSGQAFDNFVAQIKKMGDELRVHYPKLPASDFFIPRIVKDYKGLQKFFNKDVEVKSTIEQALEQRAKALKINKTDLSNQDKEFIVSNILRGLRVGTDGRTKRLYATRKAKNAKRERFLSERKIKAINEEMQKYYEKPLLGTMRYFMDASKLVEKNNFFGKNAKQTGNGINIDKSTDNFLAELATKGIDLNTETRLKQMLEAVFVDADRSLSSGWAKGYKNIVNASLLANPLSAITQLSDISMAAWRLGVRNTVKGLFNKEIDIVKDLNIDQLMIENFSSGVDMHKLVDKLLGATQFKRMDRLGKTAIVNAAWQRAQSLAKTDKGVAKLKKQYGTAFREDFTTFIDDLRNGKITPRTKEYLFNELAEFQPINPAQMPEAYLKADNGRLMYTLQSFTLKQLNLIRKHIIDEAKKGNYAEAGKNALGFALLIPPSNMAIEYGKERILGKDPDLADEVVQRYVSNALKVFGASEYAVSRLGKTGKLGDFVIDTFAPPLEVFDGILKTSVRAIADGEFDTAAFKQLPIVGRLLYFWGLDGLEKWESNQKREENRERKERFGV